MSFLFRYPAVIMTVSVPPNVGLAIIIQEENYFTCPLINAYTYVHRSPQTVRERKQFADKGADIQISV
jgi:hypothetical protein